MKPELHPWLSTPEAAEAARKAVQVPLNLMPGLASMIGADELFSKALEIMTDCALPPRDQAPTECARCGTSLEGVRKGAKFCSPNCRKQHAVNVQRSKGGSVDRPRGASVGKVAAVAQAHIGSMWNWPEAERAKWAVREVGYALLNWLRTGSKGREISASETLANMNVPTPEAEATPYEFLTEFLESKGLRVMGDETFEELVEAAARVKGGPDAFTCTGILNPCPLHSDSALVAA